MRGLCVHHLLLLCLWLPAALSARPLFDAHLHYDADHARIHSPQQVVDTLERNQVTGALVSGTPRLVSTLRKLAPELIIPFLNVYRDPADKESWHRDERLPSRIETMLDTGHWYGIGELHLFAEHRHSPVLRQIAEMVVRRDLVLLIHGDPAVIDTLFEIVPGITLLWAHAGTFPYPDLVADYLVRYPRLHVDLSMRDELIAPGGGLREDWYRLFLLHPDRFLVGVDTHSLQRWDTYGELTGQIREWLSQLPEEVSDRLARENAIRLFRKEAGSGG